MSCLKEHGALVLDKPAGMTSFDVIRRIKKYSPSSKIGHCGTLDPMATGLLVILFGKATRLQSVFLGARKSYEGEILFGQTTDSDDVSGKVVTKTDFNGFGPDDIENLKSSFSGAIEQTPPSYSAIKVNGRRSYELARKGEDVELKSREVEIHKLELEQLGKDVLSYSVDCSKGTYIRSLARDMGESLGVGACLQTIRRIHSSPFDITQASSLEKIDSPEAFKEASLDISELLAQLPSLQLNDADCESLRCGQQSVLEGHNPGQLDDQLAAVFSNSGEFRGVIQRISPKSPIWEIRFMM